MPTKRRYEREYGAWLGSPANGQCQQTRAPPPLSFNLRREWQAREKARSVLPRVPIAAPFRTNVGQCSISRSCLCDRPETASLPAHAPRTLNISSPDRTSRRFPKCRAVTLSGRLLGTLLVPRVREDSPPGNGSSTLTPKTPSRDSIGTNWDIVVYKRPLSH